jgi:hypothetical protein
MNEFRWHEASETAAQSLAIGELADKQIAENAGVTPQTLWNWKQHPDFQARIESHLEDIRKAVRSRGIGILECRVRRVDRDWKRMQQVIEERAKDPTMANVPGGSTGLLVRKYKSIGSGENATTVEEYEVDTALLKELREHEKQAAQELGQWTEKSTVQTTTSITIDATVRKAATDELEAWRKQMIETLSSSQNALPMPPTS